MAAADKNRILVADSDLRSLATLIGTLKDNYRVLTAINSKDIFKQLERHPIDLILLDTLLAGEDGFSVCHQLKQQQCTQDIPVIFVSSISTVAAEATAFDVGAADYITKPFNAPTVLARIRNQMRLSEATSELKRLNRLALDANPNTGLPGNNSILKELQRATTQQQQICVVYADLDHFKIYNDTYGFAKGDELIIFTANIIKVALNSCGCSDTFLGHIGGDDFVFILPSGHCEDVAKEIIDRLENGLPEFYTVLDLERGYVEALNREGEEQHHPLVSISMGGVDLARRKVGSVFEIVDICTEMKKAAKNQAGSNVLMCQRHKSASAAT